MREFVLAALPWVLAGLAVAIICAGMSKKKKLRKIQMNKIPLHNIQDKTV